MYRTFLVVSALTTLVASQTILQYGSGQLPSCAQNCGNLTTAQTLCVPPVAPSADQATYDTCFCQSNYFINNLAEGSSSAPSDACNAACTSSSDQLAVQNWYDSLCKSTTTTSGGAVTTTTGAAAATSTGTTSGTDNGSAAPLTGGQTWWDQHARWIAMAIVLICAFIIIGVVGIWLKRRSVRKHQRQAAMAPPVVWGPHQNQHYTGGIAYGTPAAGARNKGKGPEMAGPAGPMLPTASSQPMNYAEPDGAKKGGKLKKLFGR